MNRWKIPGSLEEEVRARDGQCIYCGVEFRSTLAQRRSRPSWEHIVNDASIVTRENIALCCIGCNASKGAKSLSVWLRSRYCASRGITVSSIAPVARAALTLEEIESVFDQAAKEVREVNGQLTLPRALEEHLKPSLEALQKIFGANPDEESSRARGGKE